MIGYVAFEWSALQHPMERGGCSQACDHAGGHAGGMRPDRVVQQHEAFRRLIEEWES